jgi:lysophospholipase L1-like esterase
VPARQRLRLAAALSCLLPLLAALPPRPVTIWLAGDSTMAAKRPEKRPETGWGEALGAHFRRGRVRVANHAQNGRSTRTFIAEGRWQAIVDSLRAGDYVFIQFGHNDESPQKVDRYTPPDDFRRNLARFVSDVRARGATPVLFTPVSRRSFDSTGVLRETHGEYPDLVRRVAREAPAAIVDMDRLSMAALEGYGPERSRALFLQLEPGASANYPKGVEDNTHFSPAGAALMARLAVEGLRATGLPLVALLQSS